MEELKRLRLSKELSQQQLADKVGVTRANISGIELGKSHPSVSLAKKIASILECDWTIFFS